MSRVPDIKLEDLTTEQKRIYGEIAGPRGGVGRGPFPIWLRNPDLADRANQFGNALRVHGKLEKRLFELMVLIVARHWSAQYEWFSHAKSALKTGLSPEVVEAIQNHRRPESLGEDERLVYEIISELVAPRTLSQPSYERALAALGLGLFIEVFSAPRFL